MWHKINVCYIKNKNRKIINKYCGPGYMKNLFVAIVNSVIKDIKI